MIEVVAFVTPTDWTVRRVDEDGPKWRFVGTSALELSLFFISQGDAAFA